MFEVPKMSLQTQSKVFQQALLGWYASAQRPLPWRSNPSIYKTVVSEFMLQQTQVKTVLPYFERWLKQFPDFDTLANAPGEDVLKYWEGLGYYSRARNLHKLAKTYVTLAPKPETAAEWQTLPGIGPYASAAISSIAHDYPAAVVDGNVVRILARLTNDTRTFKSNGEAVTSFRSLADDLLNTETSGDHNQAMMELGATVCMKHKPLCTVCPVVRFCQGAANGNTENIPNIQRVATVKAEIDRLWVVQEGKLLLHRIPDDAKQLAGQYELPATTQFTEPAKLGKALATKSRGITNKRIKETIYLTLTPTLNTESPDLHWIALDQLDSITLSGPHRRWVNELIEQPDNG
jgi:A/G-specific adenine glycosylase